MMLKKGLNLFFCFLLFVVFTTTSWAVPEYINYQGKLTDSDGNPLNGVYIMQFYLYDTATGTASRWDEQQDVTVENGIFNVKIGSDDPALNPLLPDFFDNTTPYLEIKIFKSEIGFETLDPRQQLTSTPFAMKAAVADSVVDNSVVTDMITADAVTKDKISTDAVGASEIADSAVGASEIAADAVGASEILADAVGASEIASNAVGTDEIANNAVTAAKISPHIVSSVDGVSNDGGNIDLVPGSNITIIPSEKDDTITISASIPSAYLTESEGDTRYVNSTGDTMSGGLTVAGSLAVYGPNGLYVGTDSGSDDDYIKMDSGSEHLRWDEDPNRFYLSDDLFISGRLSIGGDVDTQDAYNRIGTGTPSSGDMANNGDLYVTYDIEVGSEVYAEDYKYTTSKTYVLNIPPAEFIKNEYYSTTRWDAASDYAYTSLPGSADNCRAYAGVHLPDGANVTKIEMQYYDIHSTQAVEASLRLIRRRFDSTATSLMAEIPTFTSSTQPVIQTRYDSTIVSSFIDSNYYYVIYLNWNPSGTTLSSNLRFYGARITYTLDKVSH